MISSFFSSKEGRYFFQRRRILMFEKQMFEFKYFLEIANVRK